MPASVVLVLKLISRDFVKPTTGIVISADGMVMVPASFVSQGDEIVVLDGGTDILRNGRPAKTIRRSAADGLAVLQVKGLKRPAAVLASQVAGTDGPLHFAAFPAAEKIAKGEAPLWLPANLMHGTESRQALLSANPALPAVTGALFDRCGYLAGVQMVEAAKTSAAGSAPAVVLSKKILGVLDTMQIAVSRAACGSADAPSSQLAHRAKSPTPADQTQPKGPIILPLRTPSATEPTEAPGVGQDDLALHQDQSTGNDAPTPVETVTGNQSAALKRAHPFWLIGFSLLLLGGVYWWLKRSWFSASSAARPAYPQEPETTELQPSPAITPRNRNGGAATKSEIPDVNELPNACIGMVVIEGSMADGGQLCSYCGIEQSPVDLVIGRGRVDLIIDAAGVSRAHARLLGDVQAMTLTELGSSNGTVINGVPCLAGEMMFVNADDEIWLGDVCVKIRVHMKSGGAA